MLRSDCRSDVQPNINVRSHQLESIMKISEALRQLVRDDRGDTGFVEWVILVGVIAILGILAFQSVGQAVNAAADNAAAQIGGRSQARPPPSSTAQTRP